MSRTDGLEVDALRQAVEGFHGCGAIFRVWANFEERYRKDLVWSARVGVFALSSHPTATTVYAWSSPVQGSDKRKFYAVFQEGPIKTPADAAAIVKDYQGGEGK